MNTRHISGQTNSLDPFPPIYKHAGYQNFTTILFSVKWGQSTLFYPLMADEPDIEKIQQQTASLIASCGFLFDQDSIMGHIRMKPYGYAGDFEIINRIYLNEIRKEEFRKWDAYSLKNPAALAVRNRKRYFKELMSGKLSAKADFRLLNIASGPARDLFEAYEQKSPSVNLKTICVDMDKNAIAYAGNLNANHTEHITFVNKNIFRFSTDETFDLIWSAGLFDYFEDKSFIHLLGSFRSWLNPGGEIVIGNFNALHNPSRKFMEIFGEWHLNHRSEHELIELAVRAGYRAEQITVGRESENINLFLHIKL